VNAEVDAHLSGFLQRAYNFKAVADYETGQDAMVPEEHVEQALEIAVRLVEVVARLLA
jgi:hypothetical protein